VALAKELIDRHIVDGVWTNFPCSLPPTKTGLRRCAVILDETSRFVDNRATRNIHTVYGSLAGKEATIWIMPSVDPPDLRLRDVSVMRLGAVVIGPPIWFYNYQTRATNLSGIVDKPKQFALLPSAIFKLYDTFWPVIDDAGLAAYMLDQQKRMGMKVLGKQTLEE